MAKTDIAGKVLELSNYAAQFLNIGLSAGGIDAFSDGSGYATGGMDVLDSLLFKKPDYFANPFMLFDIDSTTVDEYGIRRNGEIEAWIANSRQPAANPETNKYFKLRRIKKFAKPAVNLAYTPASAHTAGIGVPDLAMNTSASINTGIHLRKLAALRGGTPGAAGGSIRDAKQAQLLDKNLNYLVKIKQNKAVVSGMNLAFSAIPAGQLVGAAAQVVSGLTAIKPAFSKIISKGIHAGVDNRDVIQVAIAIHYLAWREQRSTGAQQPATAVFNEIFSQRGLSRVVHKYNASALIEEPCGWLALADKLAL